jgi:hypothetical protein
MESLDDLISYAAGGCVAIACGFVIFPVHMIVYTIIAARIGYLIGKAKVFK